VSGGANATAGTVSGLTEIATYVVGGPNTPYIGSVTGVHANIGSAATLTYDNVLISGPPGPPVEISLNYDLDGGLTAGKTDPTSPLFTSARAAITGAVGGPLGAAHFHGEWIISSDGEIRRTGAMLFAGVRGTTDPFPVRA